MGSESEFAAGGARGLDAGGRGPSKGAPEDLVETPGVDCEESDSELESMMGSFSEDDDVLN